MPEAVKKSAFDPAEYGAVPFDPAEYGAVPAPAAQFGPTSGPVSVAPPGPTGTAAQGPTIGAKDYTALLVKELGPDIGMIVATSAVPGGQLAMIPRIARYGKLAERLFVAGTRVTAAAFGRAGGTVAGQQAGHAVGAEWAPKTTGEALREQGASALEGAKQQAVYGEMLPGTIEGALQRSVRSEKLLAQAEGSKRVQTYRATQKQEAKVAELESARVEEMARISAEQARQQSMKESISTADKLVTEIGTKYGPNQMEDLSGRLNRQITKGIETERKAKYGILDEIALANKESGSEVVTDGSRVVDKIIEIEKKQPRGAGVWGLWTRPEEGVGPLTQAAKTTVGKVEKAQSEIIGAAEASAFSAPGDETGDFMDVASAMAALKAAQKGYGEVPLGVSLKARGTVSRAIANPETSDELKGILRQILPDVDKMNRAGLAKIDPKLIGLYEEAKDFWHKTAMIEDRVLYGLFKTGKSVKPLTDYIEENAPRNVERIRDVLRRTDEAERYWPAVQRQKFSELLGGQSGGIDLAGLGQRIDDMGTSLPRLIRDANGKVDPVMERRVTELRKLSDTYKKLMEKGDGLVVSERLNRLDATLAKETEKLSSMAAARPESLLAAAGRYAASPHVIAGFTLGRVFGWEPALIGGLGGAAIKGASDRAALGLVKLAEDPARMAAFTRNLEAFALNGDATKLLNMKRAWDAAEKSRPTWQEAIAALSGPEAAPSHARTSGDTP